MFFIFFLIFAVLPILELSLLIKVGTRIGVFNTILLTILISLTGAWLARIQGFLVLTRIQETLSRGMMPNDELIDGFLILAGGVLLLTPGFITDSIGLIFLFPLTRKFIRFLLKRKFDTMIQNGQVVHFRTSDKRRNGRYDDIDLN